MIPQNISYQSLNQIEIQFTLFIVILFKRIQQLLTKFEICIKVWNNKIYFEVEVVLVVCRLPEQLKSNITSNFAR